MGVIVVLVLLFGYCYSESAPSLEGVFSAQDKSRLVQLFENAKIDNLESVFYVSRGLEILGNTENVKKRACEFIKGHAPSPSSLDDVFYASSVEAAFSCKAPLKGLEKDLKSSLTSNEERNITELYYIISSLANLGSKVDQKQFSAAKVAQLAEKEETITSFGRAFLIGAQLKGGDLASLVDLVEDVAAQADETPSALYFEGGLLPTATVIAGIFELGKAANKRPTLSALQATLFGNYILSIRHTESVKVAYYVLLAANALASNQFTNPVGLTRVNKKPLSYENKNFQVRLVNILGKDVSKNTVTLTSVASPDGKETAINKPFTAGKDGEYSYQLYSNPVKSAGIYTLTLSTQPSGKGDTAVPSLTNVKFSIVVSFSVSVSSAEISIIEKEQNVAVKTAPLQYPDTSVETFSADYHSKVKMTFKLINKESKDPVTAHQTFVQLIGSEGEDIYFVATPTNGVYTFELDVAESAKESFGSKSGSYQMSLVVGGATVINPFSWKVGSLVLKFPEVPSVGVSEEDEYRFKPKPEIQHLFTPPEKRPPRVISMAFSVLVLVPLVLLLPIWLILGANFSKIGLSGPWALVFHGGLAGIFALYYCFWIKLNMFETLKYLTLLGGLTFIAGNRMLKRIAKQ